MNNEQHFYDELSKAPELPDDLYSNLCVKINRKRVFRQRSLLATLTLLLVTIGGFQFTHKNFGKTDTIQSDIASELQFIQDYFTGDDLDEDIDNYVLLSGY
jgi:hypothetical protein